MFAAVSPEVKPLQVRVASAAPGSSTIGSFFGNLFGSKRDSTSDNARESSVTPTKSQAATDSKKLPVTRSQGAPPQQEPSAGQLRDAGAPRTSNLLIGAVPTVPVGRFDNRPMALGQSQQKQLSGNNADTPTP